MKSESQIGKRYGRLTVISLKEKRKYKKYWNTVCDCGKKSVAQQGNLMSGHTKSCGCLAGELSSKRRIKHGMTGKPFHYRWVSMLSRCRNTNGIDYKHYGGRGIKVCKRWERFENFYKDMYGTYLIHLKEMGLRNTTLDRINNEKGYSKRNCRWATYKQQANNRRKRL